jgi:hypothetical protein
MFHQNFLKPDFGSCLISGGDESEMSGFYADRFPVLLEALENFIGGAQINGSCFDFAFARSLYFSGVFWVDLYPVSFLIDIISVLTFFSFGNGPQVSPPE